MFYDGFIEKWEVEEFVSNLSKIVEIGGGTPPIPDLTEISYEKINVNNVKFLESNILALGEYYYANCCQSDCCQTCQTTYCQTCQACQTCQGCQSTGCQSAYCQSCQSCQRPSCQSCQRSNAGSSDCSYDCGDDGF